MKLRFSLKTVLILMTIVVVGIAFVVEPYLRLARIERTLDDLNAKRDSIEYNEDKQITSVTCGFPGTSHPYPEISLEHIHVLRHLETITFDRCMVESLEPLAGLGSLKNLWIKKCQIKNFELSQPLNINCLLVEDEKEISSFSNLPKLERLVLGFTGQGYILTFPDEPVRVIKPTEQDFDVRTLTEFPSLKELSVVMLEIENFEGLEQLLNLEHLVLHQCDVFGWNGIENVKSLRILDLSNELPDFPGWDLDTARPLFECKSLTRLLLPADAPKIFVNAMKARLPNCEVTLKVE